MSGPAIAERGMVATSHPAATDIGVEILRAGGTALDAAIAANAALGLVEPMSCGLGGDLFAILSTPEIATPLGLNGSGRAPRRLTADLVRQRGLHRLPLRGPLSVTVPGCVDGWWALHQRFGSLPWEDLLAPTIELARRGTAVPPVIGAQWHESEALLAIDPGSRETFLVDGRAPQPGDVATNNDLAEVLAALARGGRDSFYTGDIGQTLLASARKAGVPFEEDDLATHTSSWVRPACLRFRGLEVWELPANTQGLVVLDMLNILSGYDFGASGPHDPLTVHLFVEAKKRAYERRAWWIGDPERAPSWPRDVLTPGYGEKERQCIDPDRASRSIEPDASSSDTVIVAAVDSRRMAVTLVQSVFHSFGSGITPRGLGFVLQNRGSLFRLAGPHANALEPGRRPFHTLIPGLVTEAGRPRFAFGVMGGDMQPQGHVQILQNLLAFGMDPQTAGDEPRVRHDGSSTPMGDVMCDGGTVHLEPPLGEDLASALRAKGHQVSISRGGYGGYQGIWIDDESGRLLGGSESRKDGCARGY
ncbi:MAG: gamma-glutamyltransferase family protein [Candidatus Bipolaricaulota bacterium]